MRKLILLMCMGMLAASSSAQNVFTLSGTVLDEKNAPLSGATVSLYPIEKGAICNFEGDYVIQNLKEGVYSIHVSFMGYKTFEDTIHVNKNTVKDFKLTYTSLTLQEVVINYNYAEKRKKEATLNVEVVSDDYLKQNLGGSLMKSIERLPGVSTIDIGSGQSKPVIRGLGFNRVVVVENGIKHEGQQWGADHGLEIDQYAVDQIEVIKGPSSLIYGSDAIGGVINARQNEVPEKYTLKGNVDLSGKTNNDLLGTSFSIEGRRERFYAKFQATIMGYGDYKVPTDSVEIYSYKAFLDNNNLRNTAGYDRNFHVGLGFIEKSFQNKLFLSSVNNRSGFFANAHGIEPRSVDTDLHDASNRDILDPYQEVSHFKLIDKTTWETRNAKFTIDLGVQRNFRQEISDYVSHGFMPATFPDTMSFASDLGREFDKYIYSGAFKSVYQADESNTITAGLSGEIQDNNIDGTGFIIPAFTQHSVGGFAVLKHDFSEHSIAQAGLRFDYGTIHIDAYYDWFPSPLNEEETEFDYLLRSAELDRSFSTLTWSVGYTYNSDRWLLKTNVAKSFRMPIAKELGANGVNFHYFRYEVGDPDLSAEVSYQLDSGIEYSSPVFAIGITPFINYFQNYIYLNPTSEHDRLYGNGHQVYYYTQSEVLRYGGEFHSHYLLSDMLQIGLMGEYVYSEQLSGEKKGFTLPFSPPASALINIKYTKPELWKFVNSYASIDYKLVAAQTNIVPPEEVTDGYRSVNLSVGGDVNIGGQSCSVSMQIQNLFDKKYFNHTSFYRLINVPEPGRNVVVNISIPFSKNLNKN